MATKSVERVVERNGEHTRFGVVVGVDGSDEGWGALDWAARAAVERGTGLRIVYAMVDPFGAEAGDLRERVSALLVRAEDRAHAACPELAVRTAAFEGGAVSTLSAVSATAELLVVGTRGHGALASLLLGSTSVGVSARAACPVVVVPPGADAVRRHGCQVVVGVDGSEVSAEALRFALREAARMDGSLTVVHGWQLPAPLDPMALSAAGYTMNFDVFEGRTRKYIDDLVDRARAEEAVDVPVGVRVVYEHPVQALLDAGRYADLVVVGSHGRGSVAGLLLGSVSQSVLHRATSPVAVVRHRRQDEDWEW
ncbi:universal stress protein [Thermobifida alba]|uniref:universal stress protein n=1 Tax=Thermobifida alba TaxID=53522 RepID=UPI0020C1792B|nr:universal stress protein [Thermobifida alba]